MAATSRLLKSSKLGPETGNLWCDFGGRKAGRVCFTVSNEMDHGAEVVKKRKVVVRAAVARKECAAAVGTEERLGVKELFEFELRKQYPDDLKGLQRKRWKINLQMLIEKGMVDCRFFTLLGVAGSLLGSVLCFLEGCAGIVESYVHYFHTMAHRSDQGHVVELLIEAIDMFLVGTAMLIFAKGLYAMFVGSKKTINDRNLSIPSSSLFGLFRLKALPAWAQTRSISQVKTKMGHAIMMVLQVGVLEKLKNVPVVTAVDLACFAGAVLVSSACVFVLSKLAFSTSVSLTAESTY